MSDPSYLLPRRSFLRGAGVAMSLPLLEVMAPATDGTDRLSASPGRVRLCVLYKGCGVNPSSWDVTGGTETSFQLPKLLQPLAPHQKDVTILSGIDSDHRANGTHVSATLAFMTGKVKKSNYRQSQSFDQLIADEVGKETPVHSLALRGDPYIDRNDSSENYLSYDRVGDPVPVAANPEVVFNQLFRGFNNPQHRSKTKTVIDEVKESYEAVRRRASRSDRQVLLQYLEAVRDVEKEIAKFSEVDRQGRGENSSRFLPPTAARNMGERVQAMLDLIAIAFWTDTTRVASLMMAHTESRGIYDFIGVNDEFHYLSHFVRNRRVIPNFDRVNQWHASQLSYFLTKLKSLQDGEGTLFDNTVVLFGSGIKHADYHSVADLPLVLAGGGGGQIKLGRYVRYHHAPNGNLLLKLMQVMGLKKTQFGNSTEPLPGITERGTFYRDVVDDGSWKILSLSDKEIVVIGKLQVRVTAEDPNLYVILLSDGSHVEIRAGFGNINGNRMDLFAGSVMTVTGELKVKERPLVITKVKNYQVLKNVD